jgi:hypothetical protein
MHPSNERFDGVRQPPQRRPRTHIPGSGDQRPTTGVVRIPRPAGQSLLAAARARPGGVARQQTSRAQIDGCDLVGVHARHCKRRRRGLQTATPTPPPSWGRGGARCGRGRRGRPLPRVQPSSSNGAPAGRARASSSREQVLDASKTKGERPQRARPIPNALSHPERRQPTNRKRGVLAAIDRSLSLQAAVRSKSKTSRQNSAG